MDLHSKIDQMITVFTELQYLERKPHLISPTWFSRYPGKIGIWQGCFFRKEENQSTQKKPFRVRMRTNNKLIPHKAPGRNQTHTHPGLIIEINREKI